jgi:thiol-disulfide isomerase/thioredoxin
MMTLICMISASALATETFRPFEQNSLTNIEQAKQGQAFILVLWSIDCPPCLHELQLLSRLQDTGMQARVVLVSTDDGSYQPELEKLIELEKLSGYEHWQFNDVMPERLRYSIDPAWYGELPRAYFYNQQGERTARSGVLTEDMLIAWLDAQVKQSPISKSISD